MLARFMNDFSTLLKVSERALSGHRQSVTRGPPQSVRAICSETEMSTETLISTFYLLPVAGGHYGFRRVRIGNRRHQISVDDSQNTEDRICLCTVRFDCAF